MESGRVASSLSTIGVNVSDKASQNKEESGSGKKAGSDTENISAFANRTSCHGPKMIAMSANIFQRVFWIIAFLTVLCALVYFVINQALMYQEAATFQDIRPSYSVEYHSY